MSAPLPHSVEVIIESTYGAFLLGGLAAFALSGVANLQTYIYFKIFPEDSRKLKLMVATVWLIDVFHSCVLCASLWYYLISRYGDLSVIDTVPWTLSLTVSSTAAITFLVHCFYAHRLYKFSEGNWFVVAPILFLNVVRLASAAGTAVEMRRLGHFSLFRDQVRWLATLGLALSSGVDVIVTFSLWYYLQKSKSKSLTLNRVIDLLVVYAFETGSITCAATTITMICWLTLPQNLVFLGVYFVVEKLFANSLLVTLNAREQLRKTTLTASGLPAVGSMQFDSTSKSVPSSPMPGRMKSPVITSQTYNLHMSEDVELLGLPSPRVEKAYYSVVDPM